MTTVTITATAMIMVTATVNNVPDVQTPKYVVFDVGEVLIDWNPRYLYEKMFDDPKDMDFFLSQVCDEDWNARQDKGYPWADAMAEKIAEFPQYEAYIKAYHDRWREMVRGGVEGSVQILKDLKKKMPVYAITNYNEHCFALSCELWPFLTLFDGVVVSGEEKLLKPEPAIYECLYNRYDLDPKDGVFIDDRMSNIKGGEATGLRGILFENPQQLRRDLVAMMGEF